MKGVLFDSVSYDNGETFPDVTGASMALSDPNLDNSIGANWAPSNITFGLGDYGSPNLPNYFSTIGLENEFLTFGNVDLNTTSANSINISNTGNADLVVDSVSISAPGYFLGFHANANYVEVDNESNFDIVDWDDAYSISTWFRSSSPITERLVLISKSNTTNPDQNFYYSIDILPEPEWSGQVQFNYFTYSSGYGYGGYFLGQPAGSNVEVDDGKWHHIVAVKNENTLKIYVDGVLGPHVGSWYEYGSNDNDGKLRFGISPFDSFTHPSFFINETAVWDEALTPEEVSKIFSTRFKLDLTNNSGDYQSASNLIAYWNFNEGSGSVINDLTSNQNNGTIHVPSWHGSDPLLTESAYTLELNDDIIIPFSSSDLSVIFAPTSYGDFIADALIYSNDPFQPMVTFSMSGFGYAPMPDIDLETLSIDFGGVMNGLTEQESFNIYNIGEISLTIDTVYCTVNFSVIPTSGTIDAGDSLALDVTFAPDGDSSFTGTMTIVSNDPDEGNLMVALSGTGTPQAPIMEVSANPLDFGPFAPEQAFSRQLTIYNTGMLDLVIEEINISGDPGFSTTFSDATVVPNDSVVVDFQFYTEDNITEAFATASIVAANADNMDISLQAGYFVPVLYVSTTGSDETGDGSEANALGTIQTAIDSSSDGDRV